MVNHQLRELRHWEHVVVGEAAVVAVLHKHLATEVMVLVHPGHAATMDPDGAQVIVLHALGHQSSHVIRSWLQVDPVASVVAMLVNRDRAGRMAPGRAAILAVPVCLGSLAMLDWVSLKVANSAVVTSPPGCGVRPVHPAAMHLVPALVVCLFVWVAGPVIVPAVVALGHWGSVTFAMALPAECAVSGHPELPADPLGLVARDPLVASDIHALAPPHSMVSQVAAILDHATIVAHSLGLVCNLGLPLNLAGKAPLAPPAPPVAASSTIDLDAADLVVEAGAPGATTAPPSL